MKVKRHSPEQIIEKLRLIEAQQATGAVLVDACRKAEISEQTYHRWKKAYGGLTKDELKRLKGLERENYQLKKLVADMALDIQILKEVAKGKF